MYNLKIKKTNIFSKCLFILLIGIFLYHNFNFSNTISEKNIIELNNKERNKNNLAPLKINPLLSQAARNKALSIFKNNEFSHDIKNKKFSAWIKETGYKYSLVGENLAIDFSSSQDIFTAWLESKEHRDNILNQNYQETGIAIIEDFIDNKKTTLVVQVFGEPVHIASVSP